MQQRRDEEETLKVEWVKRVRWFLCSEELKTKKVMTAIRVTAFAYRDTATLEIAFFFLGGGRGLWVRRVQQSSKGSNLI